MDLTIILLALVPGLIFGSFLGALTYRLPRGESIFKGRSKCPNCGKKIAWYDNIPIFSYILLGRKCRHCKKSISSRYFWIELLTSLLFFGAYFLFLECSSGVYSAAIKTPACIWEGVLGGAFLPFVLLVTLTVTTIFVIDLEHQFIPDELVFFGTTLVFLAIVLFNPSTFYLNMLSALGAGVSLLLIHLATKGEGMGLGDVKFAIFAGLILGWPYTPVFLFLSFLTGAAVGIILILINKAKFKQQIAFGPFLIVSLIATFILGDKIIALFLP